ncbi:MAG: 6-carboxytetrahydropterin synthase [Saprospiraceae bacterium]|nr:6-carboxytetrahydropterin synthase [Saprospiraceae bacterium]
MQIAIFRKAHFNAAHRLYVPAWSDEKNFEVFGKCANPNFHGHNYVIEVKVMGEVDPVTGMLIDLLELKQLLKEKIEDKFDHKNLNVEVEEFQTMTPTVENICYLSWKILRAHLDSRYDLKVRLYETPRNFAEYPAQ